MWFLGFNALTKKGASENAIFFLTFIIMCAIMRSISVDINIVGDLENLADFLRISLVFPRTKQPGQQIALCYNFLSLAGEGSGKLYIIC